MEGDAVVTLARATVDGQTLFGQKSIRPAGKRLSVCRIPGRAFAPDEKLRTQVLELPQARQTYGVLGVQPDGSWGFEQGVNEHQVAVGRLALAPRLKCDSPGLLGTDLTRLALERSRTARQAVDFVTSFVERYGQGNYPACPAESARDNAFLVVDPTEGYAVETAGRHWVYQEVQEVRVVSNVRVIRQDWDRISHGLASYAISQGWWSDDGSKLDFAGVLGEEPGTQAPALRRWGRTTLLLMEQNGHIDTAFVRHVLSDQFEETAGEPSRLAVREHSLERDKEAPENVSQDGTLSFVASLTRDAARLAMTWCGFGTPHINVYFPLLLHGELPACFSNPVPQSRAEDLWPRLYQLSEQLRHDPEQGAVVRDSCARLQARFDQEAEEFDVEAAALNQRGALSELHRQATLFMQHNLERFEGLLADSLRARPLVAVDS